MSEFKREIDVVQEAVDVLDALGYEPKLDESKNDIYFISHGSDSFPDRHKKMIRGIMGKHLVEFYYGGIDTQHIYYRPY